jgi:hypothetical protein
MNNVDKETLITNALVYYYQNRQLNEMDKETLITNALVYYYQNRQLNETTFNFLDSSVKLQAIIGSLEERSHLKRYEYKWLIDNHPEKLPFYFQFLLEEIRELENDEIELLPHEYKLLWYEMLYEHFVLNDCVFSWKQEGYDKEYAVIIANWRDEQINLILE